MASPSPAIAPRSAPAGPQGTSTSSSSAPTRNSPETQPVHNRRDQSTLGLGRGGGLRGQRISSTSADTKNSRCRRRANGWTWTSTAITRKPEGGWLWNSGFEVKARIDAEKKIWYGEMKIPLPVHRSRPAAARPSKCASTSTASRAADPAASTSPGSPPMQPTFHVPEAFGR